MNQEQALAKYGEILSDLEKAELADYSFIYYAGQNAKDLKRRCNVGYEMNHGFDDMEGYYHALIGDHIAFRYEIIGSLGSGACGQVVKAMDHKRGNLVAVKVIRNIPLFRELADQEIEIARKLSRLDKSNNYCVVHMLNHFTFRRHPCMVFELLTLNLFEFMKSNRFRGLTTDVVREFAHEILVCLHVLQQNRIIHCDIKPQNIMLLQPNGMLGQQNKHDLCDIPALDQAHCPNKSPDKQVVENDHILQERSRNTELMPAGSRDNDSRDCSPHHLPLTGEDSEKLSKVLVEQNLSKNHRKSSVVQNLIALGGHQLKLIDFGCSSVADLCRFQYIQSRYYRAPEVILGCRYGCPIDMWSLGCVIAELLSGKPLFPGESEIDQLALMMEVLGFPPEKVLRGARRLTNFFHGEEHFPKFCRIKKDDQGMKTTFVPASPVTGHPRFLPGSRSLAELLELEPGKQGCILNFLKRCLTWDPQKRLTPRHALLHPWIQGSCRPMPRNRSITSLF